MNKEEFDKIQRDEMRSSILDDKEMRYGWDGDWSKVVDQYDGTR